MLTDLFILPVDELELINVCSGQVNPIKLNVLPSLDYVPVVHVLYKYGVYMYRAMYHDPEGLLHASVFSTSAPFGVPPFQKAHRQQRLPNHAYLMLCMMYGSAT